MKRVTDFLLLGIMLLLGFISCEEVSPEFDGIDPFVNIKFINADSMARLKDSLGIIDTNILIIDDSLHLLDSLTDAGDETDYKVNIDSLEAQRGRLSSTKKEVNAVITVIKSGSVKLTSLSGDGASGIKEGYDSASNYKFPLNVAADHSKFFILLNGENYNITFSYLRDTVLRQGTIFIEAFDIKLVEHAFDSVRFPCDTLNCTSNEATATVYF